MKIIISILFVLLFISGISQIPEIQWQQCYGTSETDRSYGIESLNNGYLIAIEVIDGEGLTNYHGSHDIWIINTDSTGSIIWEKCYGGSSAEAPQKVVKKSNNEFFIFGYSGSTDGDIQSGNYGFADLWVISINEQGELLWEKCYGSPGTDEPRNMILTPDGGFIMLARISSSGGDISQYYGSYDVWMCKCDSLGNIEWEKTLGNHGLDNGVSMMINSQNNIMMIGAAQRHGEMVECYPDEVWGDVWLVELDLLGNIVSQHCYGGSDYDIGIHIIELEDGYVFAGGTSSNDGDVSGLHGPPGGPPDGRADIWIVKLNEQFEILWQKCLGGYSGDYSFYISQTEDSGFVIFGITYSNDGDVSGNHSSPDGYDNDIWAIKLDQSGEIEWQQCYGGWGSERLENPHTILKKNDYNYVIASSTDYGPSYDVGCTPTGGNGIDRDAWIFEIDLEDTTNVFELAEKEQEIKVYPNPAREYVVFEFEVQSSKFVRKDSDGEVRENKQIRITNIFGQQVALLLVKSEVTVWDTRNIKPGVYFYSLKSNESALTGKLIISK